MKLAYLPKHRLDAPWRRALAVSVAASLLSLFATAASAQAQGNADYSTDPQAQADRAGDPPGRVGRLSDLNGQVWMFSPDSGEWVGAERNRPLTSGDRLATDAGARAEVRIGSTTLRLDSGSELEVLRLDDDRVVLQLHNGSVSTRLRNREAAAEFELKTGEGRFLLRRTGRYRFDRLDDASHVTVYSGQSVYEGPGSALTVNSGQRAEFWVDSNNAAQYSLTEPLRDSFSAWNSERDRSDDRSASARYVSPEMTGVEDLDRHGRWEQSDEYGALWFPRVVVSGWAPYSTGHWAWVRPWGWTWVDDAPWGFAPFHYGRWVWFRSAWCWAPGTYVARPVYAPALVAWVGGPRLSVSINIGSAPAVGWFPLAPREIYVPTYRVSPRYVETINITHVTNITNVRAIINNPQAAVAERDYGNRKFPHAVTVVPASVMTNRESVGPAAARLRESPAVREIAAGPRSREVALVAAPVATPPPPPRVVEGQQPPPRPRERESGDGPRSRQPVEGRMQALPVVPAVPAVAAEPRVREPARSVVVPAQPTPAATPAPAPAAVNPAQAVPMRPRVMPNPPVAPRTDVAPLPARPAAPAAVPPQAAPVRPVQPVEAAPRARVAPPGQHPRVPEASSPEGRARGDNRDDEELLRKRRHADQPQREGPRQQPN